MIRFILTVCPGILLWLLMPRLGLAQAPIHLKLHPERLVKARALEQKAIREKDSLQLAEAWYLYGKIHVFAGDLPTAQAYFLKALHVHEPRGASFSLSRLYVRLSETEHKLGRFDEALAYAKRALLVAQQSRSDKDRALVRAYGNLALLYEDHWAAQLETDTAKFTRILTYFRQAEALCYKLNDTLGIAEVHMNIGVLLTEHADRQSITYLEEALRLFTLKDKEGVRVKAMLKLAAAYLRFGKRQQAHQALQKADYLYDSLKLNEYDLRMDLESGFVTYYATIDRWKPAFDRLKEQHKLERSQILADRDGAISRLTIEYRTKERDAVLTAQDRELALRGQNLRTQQWLTLTTVGLLLMAVGLMVVFFRLNRKNERISRHNAELVKEQNHRVKNNLQVVSSLLSLQASRLTNKAAKQAVEESQLRVQSMAILHRRLYDGNQLAQVDLEDFIRELINGVLDTFGQLAVPVYFSIDPIYMSADKATPLGLILNELVTNACKYAFPKTDDPKLWIYCRRKGRMVLLEVADNGPGMTEANVPQHQTDRLVVTKIRTFGLALIDAQVTQLNGRGHFDSGGQALAQGTVFTLEFNA